MLDKKMLKILNGFEKGFQWANNRNALLAEVLQNAKIGIQKSKNKLRIGNLKDYEIISCLEEQYEELLNEQNLCKETIVKELEQKKKQINKFNITLFGRTMVGKSTLYEILTDGDGKSIGKGAQRTTLDIREYEWNGVHIIDVPGVAAFEGNNDEVIAFEAAKCADLVLFIITDDGNKAAEAEWFSKIRKLGKPLIGILNVKCNIDVNVDIKYIEKDIIRAFKNADIEKHISYFREYAMKEGCDWNNIEFIPVHLLAAFISKNVKNLSIRKKFREISRIDVLVDKVLNQIEKNCGFYCFKSYVDLVTRNIIKTKDKCIQQYVFNAKSALQYKIKSAELSKELLVSEERFKQEIDRKTKEFERILKERADSFVASHYEDDNASNNWCSIVSREKINERAFTVLETFNHSVNKRIREIICMDAFDIKDAFSYKRVGSIDTSTIIDKRKIASRIINGSMLVFAMLKIAPIPIPQIKIAAWVLPIIITGISYIPNLFENKEKKIQERQDKIRDVLYKNIDDNISSVKTEMLKVLEDILGQLRNAVNSLNGISGELKILATLQRGVALNLNEILLDANRDLVLEAIGRTNKAEVYYDMFTGVARIPGEYLMFSLAKQDYVLENKEKLEELFQEKIYVVYDVVKTSWLRYESVVGEKIKMECIKYNDYGDATIISNDCALKPNVMKRINLAQQLFSQIVVMEKN